MEKPSAVAPLPFVPPDIGHDVVERDMTYLANEIAIDAVQERLNDLTVRPARLRRIGGILIGKRDQATQRLKEEGFENTDQAATYYTERLTLLERDRPDPEAIKQMLGDVRLFRDYPR